MSDKEELFDALEEMAEIASGEKAPARETHFEGKVLVRILENGHEVWNLFNAAEELAEHLNGEQQLDVLIRTIRQSLRQSQSGFAELLGISKRTLQDWEQGRRSPNEAAKRLIYVAALNPAAVMAAAKIAA